MGRPVGRTRPAGARPLGGRAPYGFAVHAADMAALATELGASRVTVLGHSFGGVVGAVLGGGWFGVDVAGSSPWA